MAWFDNYEVYQIIDAELVALSVKFSGRSDVLDIISNLRSLLLSDLYSPTEIISDVNLYCIISNNTLNDIDILGLEARGRQCSEEFKDWSPEELEKKYKELGKGKRTKEEKALRQRIKKQQKAIRTRHSRSGGGGGRALLLFFFLDFFDFMQNEGKLPDSDGDGTPDVCDPDPDDPCEDGTTLVLL
jgi:hypothetical protein